MTIGTEVHWVRPDGSEVNITDRVVAGLRRRFEMSELIEVKSSNIKAVRFDQGVMEVHFKSGVYQYTGVDSALYEEFLVAPSAGRFLAKQIKPNHSCWRHHEPLPEVQKALNGLIDSILAPGADVGDIARQALQEEPLDRFTLSAIGTGEDGVVSLTLIESEEAVLDVTFLPIIPPHPAMASASYWMKVA